MKHKIRKKLIKHRKEHDTHEHKPGKEEKIIQKLINLEKFKKAHTILLYCAFNGEVSLRPLKKKIIKDKRLVLPKVDKKKNQLLLYEISDLKYLQKGFAGILEAPAHLPKVKPDEIELAIIPGVAFDKEGNRIGFGGGYYDRLLKKLACPKIGVAFDFQVQEELPNEPHDELIDKVITETKIITCKHHNRKKDI